MKQQTITISSINQKKTPFPKPASPIKKEEVKASQQRIRQLLAEKNAVLIAHYYTNAQVQALAEESGGFIGDSLEMAKFGLRHPAETLIIAGVRFMGETAKILTPHKRVLMPTLEAECSLDLGCPIDEFSAFCDQHPDRTVVVYANTSAAVKARADWIVTSSNATEIIEHLDSQGKAIIWGPDRHLGSYIQRKTGADMLLWDGECVVHDEFSARDLAKTKRLYPKAAVLVHPESPKSVVEMADAVGSTTQLIKAAKTLPNNQLIIATERGIMYKMQQLVPEKELIMAPTKNVGPTCSCCTACPWMAMNGLTEIENALTSAGNLHQIEVDEQVRKNALISVDRMVNFVQQN